MKRETFPMSDATWQQISRPAKARSEASEWGLGFRVEGLGFRV